MLFNLNDLMKDEPADSMAGSLIMKEKFLEAHLRKVESLKDLTGELPQAGEAYFLWTLNSFNAFTFIPFLIREHGIIDELLISTYSISERILHSMTNYLDKNKIYKVHIMISDSIKFRMPKIQEQLIVLSQRPGFSVGYAWNHSKIILLRTPGGSFVVEGSGNFSENAQFEQYVLINSPELFDFRKQCIQSSQIS